MYRIRRETGEEVTLGSIDEFGAAVAAGIVTAKAEIFHARAEKWLPIASHPHFKMAHDRITAAATPKPPARNPAVTASGQRPAVGASGQRPAAPQLRVVRADATAPAPVEGSVTQKPAPRWNSAQRPAARAVAPKPSAPPASQVSDLRLVLADTLLSGAATAPELPEVEFELLPEIQAPEIIEPRAPAAAPEPAAAAPVVVAPVVGDPPSTVEERVAPRPNETVVEHSPANVELVSHEEQPASARGEVEIINPDRTMPVVSRDVSSLDIPAPFRDFAPIEAASVPAARSFSKVPLFVGLGVMAAAAAVIGFFALRPSNVSPSTPGNTTKSVSASSTAAAAAQPAPVPTAPVATTTPPTGVSTGLGGDVQVKKGKKGDGSAATSDGLEPPPEVVIPAAPRLGKIGDAAALPTVDAGVARNDAMARAQALEKTRRAIDSSMRMKSDSQ